MKILIVNDDGYNSKGINALAKAAHNKGHEVCIVAPNTSRSGTSQSMTFFRRQVLKKYADKPFPIYSFEGSPADCTKLGLSVIYKDELPDLLLSGINSEANLGTGMYYSGTVGAVLEGAVMGVKSIALSLEESQNPDYDFFAEYFLENLDGFLKLGTSDIPLNINFNKFSDGSTKCKVTFASENIAYDDYYTFEGNDEEGNEVYMLRGEPHEEYAPEGSDVALYFEGYTVITPLSHGKTHYEWLRYIKSEGLDNEL